MKRSHRLRGKGYAHSNQPLRVLHIILADRKSRFFKHPLNLRTKLFPVIILRLFSVITRIVRSIIAMPLPVAVRSRAVIRHIEIVNGGLHTVFHHIFYRTFSGLSCLHGPLKSFPGRLHILSCNRNIISPKLLRNFCGKSLASRNLRQRLHIQIIGITCYFCTAPDKLRLDCVDNGDNLFNLHIPGMIAFLLQSGKIFLRHSIRHHCHKVRLRGHVNCARILHNLFCGLSVTPVSVVIHNFARNV